MQHHTKVILKSLTGGRSKETTVALYIGIINSKSKFSWIIVFLFFFYYAIMSYQLYWRQRYIYRNQEPNTPADIGIKHLYEKEPYIRIAFMETVYNASISLLHSVDICKMK